MSNKKISDLPLGNLNSTTIFPIVSNGVTSRVSFDNLVDTIIPLIPVPEVPEVPETIEPITFLNHLVATNDFPYPQITTDYVRITSTEMNNKRISLPSTALPGKVIRVGNKGDFDIIVGTGSTVKMYLNGIGTALGFNTEVLVPSKSEFHFIKIDENAWSAYRIAERPSVKTNGSVSQSAPNTPLTFDINKVYETAVFTLPALTNNDIGKEIIVFSDNPIGNVFIKPSSFGATISSDLISSWSGQYILKYNDKVRFIYQGNDYWFTEYIYGTALPKVLEYCANLYQAGTSNIVKESPKVNTFTFNDGNQSTNYRKIVFQRIGVGEYSVSVRHTANVPTNLNNVSVMFGDGTVRMEGGMISGGGTGDNEEDYQYKEWKFKTYTPLGVLSDGLLTGPNGAFINIKLYQ